MAGSGIDWGGSTKTGATSKSSKKGLLARAVSNLRDIVTSAPKIPAALVEEAIGLGQTVSGTSQMKSQKIHIPHVGTIESSPNRVAREQISKSFKGGKTRQGVAEILQSPGVRLLPGSYTASNIAGGTPGQLAENPVFTALDVLPYVGKVTKAATLGTKPGLALASRAATRAENLGNVAKVERIGAKGLGPRELVGELARSAEDALITKHVLPPTAAPSHLLEMSGLGGTRLRKMMSNLGVASREIQNEATDFINQTVGESYRRGLGKTPQAAQQRALQIAKLGQEGKPGWRAGLSEPEQSWLKWYEEKSNALTERWIDEGHLLRVNGEVYSATDPTVKALQRHLVKAEKAGQKAIYAKGRPTGMYAGRTADDWGMEQQTAIAKAEQAQARAVPTPFRPLVEDRVRQAAANLARDSVKGLPAGTDIDTVVSHIVGGDYKAAGAVLPESVIQALRKEAKTVWQDLKAQGYDPIYLHHTTPKSARKLLTSPRLDISRVITPSFTKPLSWNMRSWIPDMEIALSAQGVEHIHNLGVKRLVEQLRKDGTLLTQEQALGQARRMVDEGWGGKALDPATRTAETFEKMFDAWAPNSPFPIKVAGMTTAPAGTMYLPKALGRALRQTVKGAEPSAWGKLARTPMGIFRLSILGLSPAYYVGNLVSGAVMLAAHNPTALLGFRKAIQMFKQGKVPRELSVGARQGTAEAAAQTRAFRAASQLGEMLNAQEKVWLPIRVGNQVARVPRWLNNVASGIDDMYKVMGFLSGEKQALKRGFSKEAAHQSGIELAHRVLVNFDRMTPLERTAIRTAVPFASWTSHILRYVLNYPFDHPVRAAVTSAVARIKQDEWPEGLPEHFKSDLFFAGGTKRIGLTNYLPWQSTPDLFTRVGIISRLNPMLQTMMEYTGADPYTYSAPVFGSKETRFNPVSGREETVPPKLLPKFLELSPQVRYAWGRLTNDPEWVSLAEANPEAARAAAWRAFGIPIPRDLDIQKEITKSGEAQSRAESKAEAREAKAAQQTAKQSSGSGVDWGGK